MRVFLLIFLLGTVSLFGCRDPYIPAKRVDNEVMYFKRDFRVKVIHPKMGSGPNYVVRLYLSPEDANARRYEHAALTDSQGIATFKDIRMGTVTAQCKVAGNPSYCAIEYFENVGDTTWVDELILAPCAVNSD
jgi:hypothetical protein